MNHNQELFEEALADSKNIEYVLKDKDFVSIEDNYPEEIAILENALLELKAIKETRLINSNFKNVETIK